MKVTIKTDIKPLEQAIISVEAIDGKKVNVGMPDGSQQAKIAAIHEWGVTINVTPKMRAWFAYQGYPLKKSTTQIVIPERSFFRAGMEQEGEKIIKTYSKVIPDILFGSMPVDTFLTGLGEELVTAIRDYVRDMDSPANSGMTVAMKGSSSPLIDTGDMIGAIAYEVE